MEIPGYEILCTIGKGGMGIAYLASERSSGRRVVLKVLLGYERLESDDTDATVAPGDLSRSSRFEREGRVVASLRHPGIVRVYEIGTTSDVPYIAMEYLDGGDLQSRIAAGLAPAEAAAIAASVADALEYAHGRGVVHRDVKPTNILFRGESRPVLGDFGIAKEIDPAPGLTSTGLLLGSPYYMSPEQAFGREVDGRSDLYGLGVILFELLTGRRPYDGGSAMAVLMQHVQSPVPRLPAGLEAFQPAIDGLMAKEPDDRYASADLASRALRALRVRESRAGSGREGAGARAAGSAADGGSAVPGGLIEHLRVGIREDLDHERLVLPALPDVAFQVKIELERPEPSLSRVANLVRADPALSVQLLRIANSAFYAGTAPVSDVRRAVVRLGDESVHHVVMMLVVGHLFHARSGAGIRTALVELWQRSTHVAALAEAIVRRLTRLRPEEAMLGGLIHAIGTLPILDWASRVPHLLRDPAVLHTLIEELHGEVGADILERWHTAPEIVEIPREYAARPLDALSSESYVDVVALAAAIARASPGGEIDEAALPETVRFGDRTLDTEALFELAERGAKNAEVLRGSVTSR